MANFYSLKTRTAGRSVKFPSVVCIVKVFCGFRTHQNKHLFGHRHVSCSQLAIICLSIICALLSAVFRHDSAPARRAQGLYTGARFKMLGEISILPSPTAVVYLSLPASWCLPSVASRPLFFQRAIHFTDDSLLPLWKSRHPLPVKPSCFAFQSRFSHQLPDCGITRLEPRWLSNLANGVYYSFSRKCRGIIISKA